MGWFHIRRLRLLLSLRGRTLERERSPVSFDYSRVALMNDDVRSLADGMNLKIVKSNHRTNESSIIE